MAKKGKKKFTFVELLIAIVILVVLVVIIVIGLTVVLNNDKKNHNNSLIDQLNACVSEILEDDNEINSVSDVQLLLAEYGANVPKLGAKTEEFRFAFDVVDHKFYIVKSDLTLENEPVYNGYVPQNIFYFVNGQEDLDYVRVNSPNRSVYLLEATYNETLTVSTGIDIGNNVISSVVYENSADKNVIINTNTFYTSLTINDTSNGSIKHYNKVGKLIINECSENNYYEYGTSSYAIISKGNLIIENTGHIGILYKNSNNANECKVKKVGEGILDNAYVTNNSVIENKDGDTDLNISFIYKDSQNFDIEREGNYLIYRARAIDIANSELVSANSVAINVSKNVYYESLNICFSQANDYDYLLILKDISNQSQINISKTLTLDMNGKQINCSDLIKSSCFFIGENGNLNLIGNGKIINAYDCFRINGNNSILEIDDGIYYASHIVIFIGEDSGVNGKGKVILNNGTYQTSDLNSDAHAIVVSGNNAILNLMGGNLIENDTYSINGIHGILAKNNGVINTSK